MPRGMVRVLAAMLVGGILLTGVRTGSSARAAQPQRGAFAPFAGGYVLVVGPAGIDVAFSTDGRVAAVGATGPDPASGENESKAWLVDLAAGRVRWVRDYATSVCCADPVVRTASDARYVAVNADSPTVFAGSSGHPVRLSAWFRGGPIVNTDLSADGGYLAVITASRHLSVVSVPRGRPLWWRRLQGEFFALAVSKDGTRVAVASEDTLQVFQTHSGMRVLSNTTGKSRIASVGLSHDGHRVVLVRKTAEGDAAVTLFLAGRSGPVWERRLGPVSVPTLHVSRSAGVIKVGDLLGRGVTVLSGEGQTLWRSPPGLEPVEAAVSPDGTLVAVASGSRVEILELRKRKVLWSGKVPGHALSVRFANGWIAVIGSTDPTQKVPDHVWFVRTPYAPRSR